MQCSWCVTESIAGNELGSPGICVILAGSWPSFRTSSALIVIVDSFESSCQACSVALFGRWRRTSSLSSSFLWKTFSKEKSYRSKTGAGYQLATGARWLMHGEVHACKAKAITYNILMPLTAMSLCLWYPVATAAVTSAGWHRVQALLQRVWLVG